MARTPKPRPDSRYYAVPDPADPLRMTFWRVSARGCRSWPPRSGGDGARFKEQLAAAESRAEWVRLVVEHSDAVDVEIREHPERAGARFACWHARCCNCGRRLTDPTSKTYGIGPECRSGVPRPVLAQMAETMRIAVGEQRDERDARVGAAS
jgi:hypothetical protein